MLTAPRAAHSGLSTPHPRTSQGPLKVGPEGPARGCLCGAAGAGREEIRSCRGPSGGPHPAAGALTGGRSACPARVPSGGAGPAPAAETDGPQRLPACPGRPPGEGVLWSDSTAARSQGKTQTTQQNETKPKRLLCPGLHPQSHLGGRVGGSRCHHSRAPGGQGGSGRHSGPQDLRAQTPGSSVGPPPQQGVFLGRNAPPSLHLPQPGLGDSITCPAQRGTGQPVSNLSPHPVCRLGAPCLPEPSGVQGWGAGLGGSPPSMRPSSSHPRRLSGNFELCPGTLMGRINPIAFQTLALPASPPAAGLPPSPSQPDLRLFLPTAPGLVGRTVGPFHRRQMGSGGAMTRNLIRGAVSCANGPTSSRPTPAPNTHTLGSPRS